MNFHKNKWYFFLQKNSIFSVIFIFIGLISIAFAFAFTSTFIHLQKNSVYAAAQQELASHVVRFHVLAESDSKEDQELKLLVKTAVLEYMEQPLARADSADEALEILEQYTDDIIRVASDTLAEQGSYLSVKAGTERVYFPEKTYGDLTFPAGYYTAYRILLGSGEGQNWWCVLYPPLCFIDVTHSIVPEESKEEIKSFLSEEEYALLIAEDNNFALSDTDSNSQNTIEIRSRLFDWLTSLAP